MTAPAPSPPANPVKVWDPVVRLFHWSLVLMVALALVTGYLLPRPWLNQHIFGGVAAAVLVIVRLVWGFTGTFYARFAQFVASPAASLSHARELLAGHSGRHLGHNPLGAWMILALLAALAGLGLTGTLVLAGFFKAGPLAFAMSFAGGRLARNVHELLALGLGGLIVLHVAGAIYESRRTRENLVRAMVTGTKLGPQAPGYRAGLARPLLTRIIQRRVADVV